MSSQKESEFTNACTVETLACRTACNAPSMLETPPVFAQATHASFVWPLAPGPSGATDCESAPWDVVVEIELAVVADLAGVGAEIPETDADAGWC